MSETDWIELTLPDGRHIYGESFVHLDGRYSKDDLMKIIAAIDSAEAANRRAMEETK